MKLRNAGFNVLTASDGQEALDIALHDRLVVQRPLHASPAEHVAQALDTLRRSKGLDAVLMVSDEGPVFVALHGGTGQSGGNRFRQWLDAWQAETGNRLQR